MSATLRVVTRSLCAAVAWSCLVPAVLLAAEAGKYVGPTDVVASPDGKSLFVVAADAGQILVVDVAGGNVAKTIACPANPTGLAVAADGAKLYVTCGGVKGTVCVDGRGLRPSRRDDPGRAYAVRLRCWCRAASGCSSAITSTTTSR